MLHYLFLAAGLLAFWWVLSGMSDPFHLGLGVAVAGAITWVTHRLLLVRRGGEIGGRTPIDLPWLRLFAYIPWLLWQIVVANLQVAYMVLHPRVPVEPRVVRFRLSFHRRIAHLTLANSITLTPGTVTLDLVGDEYVVHALDARMAAALRQEGAEGEMERRVAHVFAEESPDVVFVAGEEAVDGEEAGS